MTEKRDPKKAAALLARSHISPAAVDPTRKKIALGIAAIADLVQIGAFPIFSEGALSIPDDALDLGVAFILLLVLGFRWRLVFSLALELVPFATLFPTWTAVVISLPTVPKQLPAGSDIRALPLETPEI